MLIGIDARIYGPKHGGIGRYVQEIIKHLQHIDNQNKYVVFLMPEDYENFSESNNFSKVKVNSRWYTLKEQILLPYLIKKHKIDLMFFPHFNVPIFYNGPYAVAIHDLIIHHYPDRRASRLPKWLYKLKLFLSKLVMRQTVKNSQAILCPSEYTKNDILKHYKVLAKKIFVVYLGVSRNLAIQPFPKKGRCSQVLTNRPYLLYVGNAYPHKNLLRLLKAYKVLLGKYKLDANLVLVYKNDYFYQKLKAHPLVKEFSHKLIFYGYASELELSELYKNASLYVFPSLLEGFGLPALEAMSYGLPVAASRAGSIPEICGNAATYFNPRDVENMAEVIAQVYNNQKLQAELRQRGYEQVKKYSWDRCAQESLGIALDQMLS